MEAVQLEDGSTAYIHHPSATLPPGGALEELAGDEGAKPDAVSTLGSYGSETDVSEAMCGANSLLDHTTVQVRDHTCGQGRERAEDWMKVFSVCVMSCVSIATPSSER